MGKFVVLLVGVLIILGVITGYTGLLATLKTIVLDKNSSFLAPQFNVEQIIDFDTQEQTDRYIKRGYFAFSRGQNIYIWSSKGLEKFNLAIRPGYVCMNLSNNATDDNSVSVTKTYIDPRDFPYPPINEMSASNILTKLQKGEFIILLLKDSTVIELFNFDCNEK